MTDTDDALLGLNDAADIGFRVAEAADRVKVGHKIIPGAEAVWYFTMDETRFKVVVSVVDGGTQ